MLRLPLRALIPVVALVGGGCAGTRRVADTPDSGNVHAWLAWDAERRPLYRIGVSIPWSDLQAQESDPAAPIRLILNATLLDTSGRSIGGKAWPAEVGIPDAGSAGSGYQVDVELATQPGEQDLAVGILVQGRSWGPEWRRRFDVPRLEPNALLLGEPQFLRRRAAAAGDSVWVPYLERYYDARTGPARARAEIYDFAPGTAAESLLVGYTVRGPEGRTPLHGSRTLVRTGPVQPFELDLPVHELGRYELHLEVRQGTRVATAERPFEIGLSDLASFGASGDAFEFLALFFTPAEVDSLRQAAPAEREREYAAFWKRRDPDPSTPENERRDEAVRRVRYANSHFTASQPGWRTARGRIYIQLGAPERIDALRNPSAVDRMERWTYGKGDKVFVFVDRNGRGDFELARTNVPNWPAGTEP